MTNASCCQERVLKKKWSQRYGDLSHFDTSLRKITVIRIIPTSATVIRSSSTRHLHFYAKEAFLKASYNSKCIWLKTKLSISLNKSTTCFISTHCHGNWLSSFMVIYHIFLVIDFGLFLTCQYPYCLINNIQPTLHIRKNSSMILVNEKFIVQFWWSKQNKTVLQKKDWLGIYSLYERLIYLAIAYTQYAMKLACQLRSHKILGELLQIGRLNDSFFQILYLKWEFSTVLFCIISNLHSLT